MSTQTGQPQYLTLNGKPTNSTDPKRGIWYSANCYYWTDDWTKLKKRGPGIPCCPECGTPGFQTTAEEWEGDNGPAASKKEQCRPPRLTSWLGKESNA